MLVLVQMHSGSWGNALNCFGLKGVREQFMNQIEMDILVAQKQ
jgi:hypothetical protein